MMLEELEQVLAYHRATKHQFHRYAHGPGHLDWTTQPDPFRRYAGAVQLALERLPPGDDPAYEAAFGAGQIEPAPLDLRSVSQLFFDSLALSAWKQAGEVSWALRINPSSGNLHPTEGYLVCGPVPGLTQTPVVGHYAPREHCLEVRARFSEAAWRALTANLPPGTVLVGLSSIHWREAWKYGERAFRYCQLDVGHAIGAIGLAAAGLGWRATVLDELGSEQLTQLLGLSNPQGAEAEHPDCLLAVYPRRERCASYSLPAQPLKAFSELPWQGQPNLLSSGHVEWPAIDGVAAATIKLPTEGIYAYTREPLETPEVSGTSALSLRRIIHQRRSAVVMDAGGWIERDAFYTILGRTLAQPEQPPFSTLPWRSLVHLVLFVHRVDGLDPGLYLLLRAAEEQEIVRAALREDLSWEEPPSCPEGLGLRLLAPGDVQAAARQLSCHQDIASDGCFSLAMIAEFSGSLRHFGPWFYRRLFWECGMIGQMLYLEAEAAGVRGTGIGCFFDDGVHSALGLGAEQFQSLYHFTVGYPVVDARRTTLPAYPK
jgi:SagB-type dehydrogenase family enzyme